MASDFNRGICECGNTIFSVPRKYDIGFVVKTGRDTLAWQWLCKGCGTVHHEPITVITHLTGRLPNVLGD